MESQVLTARQRQVRDLVASGHSLREMSTVLGISPSTVEVHLERLKHKLGVFSMDEVRKLLWKHRLKEVLQTEGLSDMKIDRILEAV